MPVIDSVAQDYLDDVAFVAAAGRAGLDATAQRAEELFSDRLVWGLDDDLWRRYGVPGQPYTLLITPDGVVADRWFGVVGDAEIRARIDRVLAAIG